MITYGVCRLLRCNGRGMREKRRKRDAENSGEMERKRERVYLQRYSITAGGINFPVVPYFLR